MPHIWLKKKEIKEPIPPFLLNASNPVKKYFTGIEANLLELLVQRYGLSLLMKAPEDFRYGSLVEEDGSFDGKIGMLQRGEVDLIVGQIVANSERGDVGTYSVMIFTSIFTLASRKPEKLPEWDAAFRPFPVLGWAILFLSIALVAPVSWFITKSHNQLVGIDKSQNQSLWSYFAHVRIKNLRKF